MLMAGPLILLYGVSILIVAMVNPEKNDDAEERGKSKTDKKTSAANHEKTGSSRESSP
jgi:sec-independent protein translocase protein TatC